MGEKRRWDKNSGFQRENSQTDYKKWIPVLQNLGLKPRRFLSEPDAAYICTAEGWFRLSPRPHQKEELTWLRSVLEYLEEHSFKNWAVAWQRAIIWEELNGCYLIQPWCFTQECFQTDDPAALERVTEILAELYRCGKDVRENCGLKGSRERWSTVAAEWKEQLMLLQTIREEIYPEKIRKEVNSLRKATEALLSECLHSWESGINSLSEHQYHLGVLGHGQLLAKYIVWRDNDYYLLNWEHISFQPKVVDLASLINDVAVWEPEWIIHLIKHYTKVQPLWPEEYQALKAILTYPEQLIRIFRHEPGKEVDYKIWKEADKELKRKGRCLEKVWQEISSEKSLWAWGKDYVIPKSRDSVRMTTVLSPVESWSSFSSNQPTALSQTAPENKFYSGIWSRLVNPDQIQVADGCDDIRKTASTIPPDEQQIAAEPVGTTVTEKELGPVNLPEWINENRAGDKVSLESGRTETTAATVAPSAKNNLNEIINWADFPKPSKRGKGQ